MTETPIPTPIPPSFLDQSTLPGSLPVLQGSKPVLPASWPASPANPPSQPISPANPASPIASRHLVGDQTNQVSFAFSLFWPLLGSLLEAASMDRILYAPHSYGFQYSIAFCTQVDFQRLLIGPQSSIGEGTGRDGGRPRGRARAAKGIKGKEERRKGKARRGKERESDYTSPPPPPNRPQLMRHVLVNRQPGPQHRGARMTIQQLCGRERSEYHHFMF